MGAAFNHLIPSFDRPFRRGGGFFDFDVLGYDAAAIRLWIRFDHDVPDFGDLTVGIPELHPVWP
mgnify:CR=1 FL=1